MSTDPLTEPGADRMELILALRRSGHTLRDIGDLLGISSERVRQLLVRATGERYTGTSRFVSIDIAALRAALIAEPSIAAAARALNVSRDHVLRHVRELELGAPLRRLHRMRLKRRLLDELRALAARLGRTPSTTDLGWGVSGTSFQRRYHKVFGSLTRAQALAGLVPNGLGAVGHIAHRRAARWDATQEEA